VTFLLEVREYVHYQKCLVFSNSGRALRTRSLTSFLSKLSLKLLYSVRSWSWLPSLVLRRLLVRDLLEQFQSVHSLKVLLLSEILSLFTSSLRSFQSRRKLGSVGHRGVIMSQ
jgi:hypothetical protein